MVPVRPSRGCAAAGGSFVAAALLLVGRSLLLRSYWGVVPCGCVAVAASRPALRKGLDRRTGPGAGRALGAWLGVTQDSAFVHEGSKDAAFTTGSRHQRSIVRVVAREGRILRPPEVLVRRVGRGSPFARTVPRRRRITALQGAMRRHDSPFARHGPREGRIVRESRTDEESWPRPADPTEPSPPLRSRPSRRPHRLAATVTQQQAGTRPRPADPTEPSPPLRSRPSRRPPRREATTTQQQAKTPPRPADPTEPSPPLRVKASRSAGPLAATATQQQERTRPRPANPTGPSPTAPLKALSETTPTRSHNDAAASGVPSRTRRRSRTDSPEGRDRLSDAAPPACVSTGPGPRRRAA